MRIDAAALAIAPAFLAGTATLLFELGWLRRAGAELPGTVPAAGVVVPALLLAWAIGSAVAGRRADRAASPLAAAARWFAVGGVVAWFAPSALGWLADLVSDDAAGRRLIVGAGPVLPVGFLLGGAVPWLARARARSGLTPRRATGMVAAAFGLGGALGAALFVPALASEAWDPTSAGALLLFAAAAVSLALVSVEGDGAEVDEETASPVASRALGSALLVAAFVGGLLLVGGQLGALRLSAQLRGDSVVTTSEVLGALHVGMGLGAWLLAWGGARASVAALVALLLGVAALGPTVPLVAWDDVAGWSPVAWSLLVAGLLGLGAGSIVTAASAARVRGAARFGSWVGDLGAASTLGSLVGGLVYLGVLMPDPGLGTPGALRLFVLFGLVTSVALALGAAVAGRRADGAALGVVGRASSGLLALGAVAVAVLVVQRGDLELPWRAAPDDAALLARREGPHGVVSLVATTSGESRLKLDGRFGLGGSASALEWRMGRVSAGFAPGARDAVLLGVGRGHTLGGLAEVTDATLVGVERNGDVLALDLPLPLPPDAPSVDVVHADARAFLAARRDAFDLIVGDLFFPWMTGAGELFTVEHLLTVRAALRDDGVYVQWLPLHQLPWDAFASITRSVLQAFPDARLVVAQPLSPTPVVALVGGLGRSLPPSDAIDALYAAAPSPLGPNAAVELHDLAVCGAWTLVQAFDDAPLVTSERPVSELLSLRLDGRETFLSLTNLRLLAQLAEPLTPADVTAGRADVTSDDARAIVRELAARSTALRALLVARSAELALVDDLAMLQDEREGLEREIDGALLAGWGAFPRHLALRTAIVARAEALRDDGRTTQAGALLEQAHKTFPDDRVAGVLGGLLLQLGYDPEALTLLEGTRGERELSALTDRTLLVNLGSALVRNERDADALEAFRRTRDVFGAEPLPARALMLLGVLEDDAASIAAARTLVTELDAGERWKTTIARLLFEHDQAGEG